MQYFIFFRLVREINTSFKLNCVTISAVVTQKSPVSRRVMSWLISHLYVEIGTLSLERLKN